MITPTDLQRRDEEFAKRLQQEEEILSRSPAAQTRRSPRRGKENKHSDSSKKAQVCSLEQTFCMFAFYLKNHRFALRANHGRLLGQTIPLQGDLCSLLLHPATPSARSLKVYG